MILKAVTLGPVHTLLHFALLDPAAVCAPINEDPSHTAVEVVTGSARVVLIEVHTLYKRIDRVCVKRG